MTGPDVDRDDRWLSVGKAIGRARYQVLHTADVREITEIAQLALDCLGVMVGPRWLSFVDGDKDVHAEACQKFEDGVEQECGRVH